MPDKTQMTFLGRLRDSEDQAWQLMNKAYKPLIRDSLRKCHIHNDDLDDLSQDILIRIGEKIGDFEHNGNTGAFRNWVRQITVNLGKP